VTITAFENSVAVILVSGGTAEASDFFAVFASLAHQKITVRGDGLRWHNVKIGVSPRVLPVEPRPDVYSSVLADAETISQQQSGRCLLVAVRRRDDIDALLLKGTRKDIGVQHVLMVLPNHCVMDEKAAILLHRAVAEKLASDGVSLDIVVGLQEREGIVMILDDFSLHEYTPVHVANVPITAHGPLSERMGTSGTLRCGRVKDTTGTSFVVLRRPYGAVALFSGVDLLLPETMWVAKSLGATIAAVCADVDLALASNDLLLVNSSELWRHRGRCSAMNIIVANKVETSSQVIALPNSDILIRDRQAVVAALPEYLT
jgi:hypothetical protein